MQFTFPELDGISKKTMDEHIGLYEGYVKNFNAMTALAGELMHDSEKNSLAISELMRRRSFEFGGMRLHEHYFPQFEGSPGEMDAESGFAKAVAAQYGKAEYLIAEVRQVANTRGPGWSILYFDPSAKQFLVGFTEEQHQGNFPTLPILLALDVWEHAFILDYGAQGKAKYLDSFFKNLNWSVVEKRFAGVAS